MKGAFTVKELRRFCQDRPTFREILDRVGPNSSLEDFLDSLLVYCQKRELFPELLSEVRECNPNQYKRYRIQIYTTDTVKKAIPQDASYTPQRITDMPCIKGIWWREHFERLVNEFDVLKSAEWEGKPYLEPLCKSQDGGWDLLRNRVLNFLNTPGPHILLLVGKPGAGKTTFLESLTCELAGQAVSEAKATDSSQAGQPKQMIPIFFDMGCYERDEGNPLARQVTKQGLDRYGLLRLRNSVAPEVILQNQSLSFAICMDALDEIPSFKTSIRDVQEFFDSHIDMKAVVTCRADALEREWKRKYSVVEIELLSESQVLEYLEGRVDTSLAALEFLLSDEELFQLACIPLMLDALAEYWYDLEQAADQIMMQQIEAGEEKTESVSVQRMARLGEALDRLFWQLFDHESKKSLVSGCEVDAIHLMETLSDLAREMDGKRYKATRRELVERLRGKANLQVYSNIGVLRQQRMQYSFVNPLAQVYFAALAYKLVLIEDVDKGIQLLNREVQPNECFWHLCISILEDIVYRERDISSILALLPSQ